MENIKLQLQKIISMIKDKTGFFKNNSVVPNSADIIIKNEVINDEDVSNVENNGDSMKNEGITSNEVSIDKKEKILDINDNKTNNIFSELTSETKKIKNIDNKNLNQSGWILSIFDEYSPYFIILLINLLIWISIFYQIVLKNNVFFSIFEVDNLWDQVISAQYIVDEKSRQIKNLKLTIDEYVSRVPRKIYLQSQNYINLSDNLKKELNYYYDQNTWLLNVKNANDIEELQKVFKENESLSILSISYDKEHILNTIVGNKIYWKEVYNKLHEATNNAFKYNSILNYITYDNFSVDEVWKIFVSWMVKDPSWKVFAQLINLTKAINSHDNFYWADIFTYQKKVNSDKDLWWMESAINLSFFYTKNKINTNDNKWE